MPARKNLMDERSAWTSQLEPGPDCSIGQSTNEAMNWDGTSSSGRQNEDRVYTCLYQNIQLYLVLDGHDGVRAVNFSQGFIPHLLLRSELVGGDKRVMDALRNAIVHTEREFFISIDPYITRKVTLQLEIEQKAPEADSSLALRLFPNQIAEIGRLDDLIKGGTTVVAALIFNNHLYVANVGDSRALLCSQSGDGSLVAVQQLSVDHNTSNEEELRRLEGCGLEPNALRRAKRLGMQQNTRSIGDYSIKGGYTSVDIISHATCEPGTAEPHLHPPLDLSAVHGFLVLMSDGLYEAYEAWTGRPDRVNEDIAQLVAQELKMYPNDLKIVAQNVVDKVKTLYRDTCKRDRRSGRLDDITLVVKLLGQISQMLTRSQSTRSPHHHIQPHPHVPPSAPPTDRHFDFQGHNQQFSHHGGPATQPASRSAEFSSGAFTRPEYYRQDAYRHDGGAGRGYYSPHLQHREMMWRPGEQVRPGWDQGGYPSPAPPHYEGYGGYYPSPHPHEQHPPYTHHVPPTTSNFVSPHNQHHARQGSEPKHDDYRGHNETKPFDPMPVTRPYKTAEGTQEFHTGSRIDHGFVAGSRVEQVRGQEEQPPPVPPRVMSMNPGVNPADDEMYGWRADSSDPRTLTSLATQPQPPDSHPHPPDSHSHPPETLDSKIQEHQTLQEPKAPLNQQPPIPTIIPPKTLEEPQSGPPQGNGGGAAGKEAPQTMEEPDEGGDFLYYDEEREDIGSSPEEEEEPAGDGKGTIKPYVRFTDRFPFDLSWDEIKTDPSSK